MTLHTTRRSAEPTVSIIVPARNEARNLEVVLPSLPPVHQVIVVDGCSTDGTRQVVEQTLPSATFIQQTRRGKGNALACGFEAATGDVVVMFDADGSADAAEIDNYVAALTAGADFAKGSRLLGRGGSRDITRLRSIGNRALTRFTNVLFKAGYTDLCYGYNAFWRDLLPLLAVPSSRLGKAQWGDGFEIETLINCRAARAGLRIQEVPSVELQRLHGESHLNTWRDGARVLRTVLTERWSRRRSVLAPAHQFKAELPSSRCSQSPHTIATGPDGGLTPSRAPLRSRPPFTNAPIPTATRPGPRILVVGSGWKFTSGISYYTCRLTNALAKATPTSALLMRQLVPTALYPGHDRVGLSVSGLDYATSISVFDGVDWFWGPSMRRARRFMESERPDVVVLQWWTGAVLHSYLRLAILAKRGGAKVIMEWHEVQDTGEARIPGVVQYTRRAMRLLLRHVDAHVVHSTYDMELLAAAYDLEPQTASVIPHGPYDHLKTTEAAVVRVDRSKPRVFNVLYFGLIRPYKGLLDLVHAFSLLPDSEEVHFHLTIVGETWEGCTAPLDAVEQSPNRERITVVNRYVTDFEASRHFAAADVVVLPYHRSSSSGPLHMTMSMGLPVVVTAVGGLKEAASGYAGATFVPPRDPSAIASAILKVSKAGPKRFRDPHSWDTTTRAYAQIIGGLGLAPWGA